MALHFVIVEKLSERLATLSPLVDRYERGDPEFASACARWLHDAEQLMSALRLAEGAELAALRARISGAGDRLRTRQPSDGSHRASERRARNAAAADALERAESVLRERLQRSEARLQHFEQKLVEAMTAAVLVELIPLPTERPWERWLARVWANLRDHQATRPTTVYLAASLLAPDRLHLLDRVLTRLLERELPVLVTDERDATSTDAPAG